MLESLSGTVLCTGGLSGTLSVTKEYESYAGDYVVSPNTSGKQTLATSNKLMKQDLIVEQIPYVEIANEQEGITVSIG